MLFGSILGLERSLYAFHSFKHGDLFWSESIVPQRILPPPMDTPDPPSDTTKLIVLTPAMTFEGFLG